MDSLKIAEIQLQMLVLVLIVVNFLVLFCPETGRAKTNLLDVEHELSMEFETPHTDWAQPYAQGKISVLFFSSGRGTKAREIIELMQRFDIEASASFWNTRSKKILGKEAGHKRLLKLLKRNFDCYLFNEVSIEQFSSEEQYKILKKVTEGAGIVMVGVSDERVLKPKNRIEPLPTFLSGNVDSAFTVSEGRGVRMSKHPRIDYHHGWEVEYDYWQERLGRAVLWASGHEPLSSLNLKTPSKKLKRKELPIEAFSISWKEVSAPFRLKIRLRRHDGLVVYTKEEQCNRGKGELKEELPIVRAGVYHLDVWAKRREIFSGWDTDSVEVTSEQSVSQKLSRDWGEIGEEIVGTVNLARPLAESEKLSLKLVDRHNRVLSQTYPTVVEKNARFQFPIKGWMPSLLRVKAAAIDSDGEVASAYSYFRVTKRNRGQFNFLVWDYPRGTLAPYAEDSLSKLGTTVQLSGGNPPLSIAAYDIAWVPYTTRIMAKHDEKGIMKPVCWNKEPEIQDYVNNIAEKYLGSRQHGVFAYSLGDEVATKGSCVHPACIEAYQRYLKEQYGTIEALNASWESNYENFEEVVLLDSSDNDAKKALKRKNYPRWYDRQAFKSYNQVKLCERFAQEFRELDPKALTGFEGAGRMRDGDDYRLIVRKLDFWSPYPGPGDEIIRSISPPDFITGNWMGYAKEAEPLIRKYWRMILRGKNVVQWWRWDSCQNSASGYRWHGLLAPHLGPYPAVKELVEDTKVIREGLGTLLMHSEMLDDGIAILYSHPSVYANRIESSSSYGGFVDDHIAWHRIIRQTGLQFRYVTDRMLRMGEFKKDKFKMLILSRTEAIAQKEAEVIEEFVKKGGTLLADIRPGLYDGHLKPQAAGVLDELFGIERADKAKAETATAKFKCTLNGEKFDFTVDKIKYDPSVHLSGADALGKANGTPLVVWRKLGEGQAIFLNFSISTYPDLRDVKNGQLARFVEQLFATAGIQERYTMRGTDGSAVRDVEMVRWRNGDSEIVALAPLEGGEIGGIAPLKVGGMGKKITITLPEARHIYNLREHSFVGFKQNFSVTLLPARATFCVLRKRKIPKASITLRDSSAECGQIVRATLRVPEAKEKHPLRVRVLTPSGLPADWLNQVVLVDGKGKEMEIPIAFNDPQGDWTIKAIDLYTNKAVTTRLTVR